MAQLSSALVLNQYILHLFGVKDLEALSENLKDAALEGYDENNVSNFYHALINRFYANEALPKELLYQYDQNIYRHTSQISSHRGETIKWKYFQYLTLLFTEIYLDKYFTDANALKDELNAYLHNIFLKQKNNYKHLASYLFDDNENDLNKLAYWNATGSGKTLLMHVNILQYQQYLKKAGKEKELNRIIVLTPNEGLSKQHLREFEASALEAELFDKNVGSLFRGNKIEILEITSLREKSGVETVALESFESNNLLLVDEGHRGIKETSSKLSWKQIRDSLSAEGFSFEYSATFGQAVAAAGSEQQKLLNEYGKSTLFDYSYRYFYHDGYGKDYQILNLDDTWSETYVELYLTACLLQFFEQLVVYKNNRTAFQPFLVEKPLAIFVGKSVTKSLPKETASDVVTVLKFLDKFVRQPDNSIQNIHRILQKQDGLTDKLGRSVFRNAFKHLQGLDSETCFEQLLTEVFHSGVKGALLHIENLKGQDGEIGLRIGNSEYYFGVINVGDDKKLTDLCEEVGMLVDEKEFADSLFHGIDSKDSSINMLIGSKKFSEGWSSWRVSMMGLMNIGKKEGSEIIQLFGRGVRLKGYRHSLKRSSALDYSIRPDVIPSSLPVLETLNVFGIRSNYMDEFNEYLKEEGLPTGDDMDEYSINILPVIDGLSEKGLKYLRVKEGVDFKKSEVVDIVLNESHPTVYLNWYPKVQYKSSRKENVSDVIVREKGKLREEHLAFFNWEEIYFELEKFKNERSWYNLNLSKEELRRILYNQNWYQLEIPSAELAFLSFEKVKTWQEIAISLLKQFCEKCYNRQKSVFLNKYLETAVLDRSHPNFADEYKLLVKRSEFNLIQKIKELKEKLASREFKDFYKIDTDFEALYFDRHLYAPILYLDKSRYHSELVQISPVALNNGERDFVNDLKHYHQANAGFFADKELYLLRNISKKGIGFFETHYFYPDFIIWVVTPLKQHIIFLDPKGLRQVDGLSNEKIQLHKTIKEQIETQLNDPNISLHSFIISSTPYRELKHWKGQESIADFNEHHVYFRPDQNNIYIGSILASILENK